MLVPVGVLMSEEVKPLRKGWARSMPAQEPILLLGSSDFLSIPRLKISVSGQKQVRPALSGKECVNSRLCWPDWPC